MAEDRERLRDRAAIPRRPHKARQDGLHHDRGNDAGRPGKVADQGTDWKAGRRDQHRHAAHPHETEERGAAGEAGAQSAQGAAERILQADVAGEKGLSGEPVETHAHEDDRHDRHEEGEPPQKFRAAEQDQRGLDLEHDRHWQDDERRHHVGRAHRSGIEADDHRARHHRRHLADSRKAQRKEDAKREITQARKRDQAVNGKAAVTKGERNREHRRDLARVDLSLAQWRREQNLERRALPLTHE